MKWHHRLLDESPCSKVSAYSPGSILSGHVPPMVATSRSPGFSIVHGTLITRDASAETADVPIVTLTSIGPSSRVLNDTLPGRQAKPWRTCASLQWLNGLARLAKLPQGGPLHGKPLRAATRDHETPPGSDVQLLHLSRPLHDELEAGADVLPEQVVDRALRVERRLFRNGHAQSQAPLRVQRRGLELLGGHLPQALEAHDVGFGIALGVVLEDARAVRVVEGPVGVLSNLDLVQRRLGDEDAAVPDQLAHVPVEEGQQQRGDVVPVAVRVHQQEDLPVAQVRGLEVLADPAAQGGDDVLQLLVLADLLRRRLLGIEDLPAEREDGLRAPVATLLGGPAGGVAFDDEELALLGV